MEYDSQGYTLEDFQNIDIIEREKKHDKKKIDNMPSETKKIVSRMLRNIENKKLNHEYKKNSNKQEYISSKLVDNLQVEWSFGELPLRLVKKKN